jgi:hypothetical protein
VVDFDLAEPGARGCNAPAARFKVSILIKTTELVLAGRTKTQIFDALSASIDKKELPALEVGAMCYMMSKQAYLSDSDPHWHPHLMFIVPLTEAATWGAGAPGSPVINALSTLRSDIPCF